MKKIPVILLSLLLCTGISAQKSEPVYYFDGEKVDFKKMHIRASGIESIEVKKDTAGGEIYIKSKEQIAFYSLADILSKYTDVTDPQADVLYMIKGKVVNDTTAVRIDRSFFIYTDVQRTGEAAYLPGHIGNLVIVNIMPEVKERKPEIRLRGEETN